jgi:hypothetical protein
MHGLFAAGKAARTAQSILFGKKRCGDSFQEKAHMIRAAVRRNKKAHNPPGQQSCGNMTHL